MHHLIIGYGYSGFYLAQQLLKQGQTVTAVSRHLDERYILPNLNHIARDISEGFNWGQQQSIVYYLIPPTSTNEKDVLLKQFLSLSTIKAKKIIYFGSSGVYGRQQGAWVNEDSECIIDNERQQRRLDAEQQWFHYCQKNDIECIVLRIAGIYGPMRLPIAAAKAKTPLIQREEAPYINHIYVKDLAAIVSLLATTPQTFPIYNIADGHPCPMGAIQERLAEFLKLEPAPYESWIDTFKKASPMKREFMQSSKRLNIQRLKTTLNDSFHFTSIEDALKNNCL